MDSPQTPRVNGKYMGKYIGRVVSLVCEVVGVNERGQSVVRASDGAEIVVTLPPGEVFDSQFAQIDGKVSNGNHLEAFRVVSAGGSGLDLAAYDQAVELLNGKYEALFV